MRKAGKIGDCRESILETRRLYLRQFQLEDADLLYKLDSDPEVMRFITKGAPTPLDQIHNTILPRILTYYTRFPPEGCWAAHLLGTDEFIGWFHLRADKLEPGEMELGYRLKRAVWRQGLATEGSLALLGKAFRVWDHSKVCARTLLINHASRRVMEKCGLVFEGEFSYGVETLPGWSEEERRAVKYAITRGEWG
jgi:RimJ/RimL family protein N-acetyltransferase